MSKFYQGQDNKRKEKEGKGQMKRIIFLAIAMCLVLSQATPNAFAIPTTGTSGKPVPAATPIDLIITGMYYYRNGVLLSMADSVSGQITFFANGNRVKIQGYAPPDLKAVTEIKVNVNGKDVVLTGATLEEFFAAKKPEDMVNFINNHGGNVKSLTPEQVKSLHKGILTQYNTLVDFNDPLIRNNFAVTEFVYRDGELQEIRSQATDTDGQPLDGKFNTTTYSLGLRISATEWKVNDEDGIALAAPSQEYTEFKYEGGRLKYALVHQNDVNGKISRYVTYNDLAQDWQTHELMNPDNGKSTFDSLIDGANFQLTSEKFYDVAGRIERAVTEINEAPKTTFYTYNENGQEAGTRTYATNLSSKPSDDTMLLAWKDNVYNDLGGRAYSLEKREDGRIVAVHTVFNKPWVEDDRTPESIPPITPPKPSNADNVAGRAQTIQGSIWGQGLTGKTVEQLVEWAGLNRYKDWRAAYIVMGDAFLNRLKDAFSQFTAADIENLNKSLAARKVPLIDTSLGSNPDALRAFFDKIRDEYGTNKTSAAQYNLLFDWAMTNNSQNDKSPLSPYDPRADYVLGIAPH